MGFSRKLALGSLLVLSATPVFAVDTADLQVIATIAPTACTPTFAGGGVIDYGLIPTTALNSATRTLLPVRSINYSITCDAPIAIGTSWQDSRTSSAVGGGPSAFGLGMQGSASIGRYTITQRPGSGATGDGAAVDLLQRDTNGPWVAVTVGLQTNSSARIQAYAMPGNPDPAEFTVYAGTFEVAPSIAPTSTLDLSKSIALDGLATMTVRYL
ncbi:DUF1120 domain-containing protein [Pseudomonas fluorescens]|uniref:DUF1120 domain-containing protein n=1 Tax=Pseudomonas fluorescens TaxID=294 RepID=UPI000935FE39|nr:DUF1120 domain-containing protein [Pseudomonas fluorescens]